MRGTRNNPGPSALVHWLDPPREQRIKDEPGTRIWREVGENGRPRIVKLYRQRGIWPAVRGPVTGYRTQREYEHLRHLVRWGVPCTIPVGWAWGRSTAHGYHEILITEEVPEAVQLLRYVQEHGGRVSLSRLYRTVRLMHESGFCHQTLYPRNVLVGRPTDGGREFFISDVPRSWILPRSIVGTGMALSDLLDLIFGLRRLGVDATDEALDAYGMDASGRRWWARHERDDPSAKTSRLLRDATVRMRWAGGRCLPWRSPNAPPAT